MRVRGYLSDSQCTYITDSGQTATYHYHTASTPFKFKKEDGGTLGGWAKLQGILKKVEGPLQRDAIDYSSRFLQARFDGLDQSFTLQNELVNQAYRGTAFSFEGDDQNLYNLSHDVAVAGVKPGKTTVKTTMAA